MHAISQAREDPGAASLRIRRARAEDVPLVSALDAEVTGLAKPDYWRDVFERYGERRLDERFFLIAEIFGQDRRDPILGFIVGEVRAWEFGSQPCGWVFAFSVEPEARLKGVGTSLFDAIAAEFKHAGVDRDADHGRPRQSSSHDLLSQRGDDGRTLHSAREGSRLRDNPGLARTLRVLRGR